MTRSIGVDCAIDRFPIAASQVLPATTGARAAPGIDIGRDGDKIGGRAGEA
jgi:hypothetical protein